MQEQVTQLTQVSTPAAIVDATRLRRNCERMAQRAAAAGVVLRPHLKTAKCETVARLAAGMDGPLTVSTVAEAEYFAARGFLDLTYAVVAMPQRLERLARVQQVHGARVRLIADDAAVVGKLAAAAQQLGARFEVLIEIDSGEHRTGVAPDAPAVLEVGRAIAAAESLDLAGVLTHAGHSYACRDPAAIAEVAETERQSLLLAAARLRRAGLPCPVLSAGSTPTAVHARSFEGLTEIRPGVYTFFDLAQLGRQCCSEDDLALSVLATVISHQPQHRRLIIDAGALALSKDRSANELLPDAGYGWVVDAASGRRIDDLRVAVADQEHGYVEGNIPFNRLPVGSRVRVLPNHACITAAQYAGYHVVEEGRICGYWPRVGGW